MQLIANEMGYSESSFITSDARHSGEYHVRIFTPKKELPFAGHPVLGTAYVIRREIMPRSADLINLNLKAGQVQVTIDGTDSNSEIFWMKQMQPEFGRTLEFDFASQLLGLDISELDTRYPVQEVSTGLPDVIVPIKTLTSLKRAKIAKEKYPEFVRRTGGEGLVVFSAETYEPRNQLNVRVFADCHGIPEDPATGSGNRCLAAYLVRNRYFGGTSVDIRVEQGYEIGRPSLLFLRSELGQGTIDVHVGGRVILVAEGHLL
jgi:trans-2,3-dihydro-3-hydroxyanthranilate isomerase